MLKNLRFLSIFFNISNVIIQQVFNILVTSMYQKNQGIKKLLIHAIIFVFFLPIETSAQRKKDRNKKGEAITNTIKKSKAILYANFVNEGTKPDEDLFKVHEHKENHYAAIDMVGTLKRGIFSETRSIKNVDLHRRNLQKYFIN